jgi:magnesium transporter
VRYRRRATVPELAMIRVYSNQTQRFEEVGPNDAFRLADDIIWIDLLSPESDAVGQLEAQLGIDLPTRDELKDIEPSSRLYQEDGATYMTATLLHKADTDEPETTNVAFILHRQRLLTIRYAEPRPFRAFMDYAGRERTLLTDGAQVLVLLLEAIVDRNAEVLERTGTEVDSISRRIFSRRVGTRRSRGADIETALTQIAWNQNIAAKARESLVSLGRLVSFAMLAEGKSGGQGYREHLKSIGRDLDSLASHASFLLSNVNFLLDAALGLINVEQNQIIKIFSVAAVIFLPPTLVASIYGMNFEYMPELHWLYGYPLALGLMLLSALLPYWIFKRRGWL